MNRWLHRSLTGCAVLAVSLVAYACSDDNSLVEPPGGASIGISLAVASATLNPSESAVVSWTITRGGGYTGPVELSVAGLPTGIAPNIQPNPVPPQISQGVVQFFRQIQAPTGTFDLTVRANGAGVEEATAALQLIVN
jgi:trimeric autotransporter adhesin